MELCNSPNTNAARAWNCNCGTIRITSRPSTASPRTPSNAPSGCWPKVSSIPQVASNLGYGERWVRSPIHRYNRGLPMKNLRHQNKGQAPLLSPELQEAFYQALRKPHPRDGLWNIRNAAEWLSQRLGRPVDPRRAWSWMRRLGFAPLRPRPRHRQADPEARAAFKKNSS